MNNITVIGLNPDWLTKASNPSGSPAKLTKFENMDAPIMTEKRMAVVCDVSLSTALMSLKVS